jgi:CheY-like chemotaxis protein
MSPLCLVLSDDLLDASRVIGEGRAAGLAVLQCRDSGALLAAVERGPALALLDLHNPGLELESAVGVLRAVGARVIGYGSHVDAARLKAARKAGCDEVLPRSAFFEDLGDKLRHWSSHPPREIASE